MRSEISFPIKDTLCRGRKMYKLATDMDTPEEWADSNLKIGQYCDLYCPVGFLRRDCQIEKQGLATVQSQIGS